eukprot:TRINITY_DN9486_c0_g1_i2.p3 TRINITY_DN9486_c0_g1~~TRINITY_DN9486_c0_g1_i2.p3  ORF type:complete len:148 (+),score=9.46 TRINITY_DN9486_c0_g1_i2:343-786(+)
MGIIFGPLLLSIFLLCVNIFKLEYLEGKKQTRIYYFPKMMHLDKDSEVSFNFNLLYRDFTLKNKKVFRREYVLLIKKDRNTLKFKSCLLYTSDAADDMQCVDLGGRRIIKKKKIPIPRRTRAQHAIRNRQATSKRMQTYQVDRTLPN